MIKVGTKVRMLEYSVDPYDGRWFTKRKDFEVIA